MVDLSLFVSIFRQLPPSSPSRDGIERTENIIVGCVLPYNGDGIQRDNWLMLGKFNVVLMISFLHLISSVVIIIIRQPLCPVVGRMPRHTVSKLPRLVLSSAISCRSSICPGRLSTAWLVSLVVFSCHKKLWSPSGGTRGPSVAFEAVDIPCPGPFHFLTV